jgi:hypothetical protein
MRFNDRLLQSLHTDWKDWSGRDVARLDPAGTWEAELATLIQEEFGASPLFLLKDPRFCRIAPLLFRASRGWDHAAIVLTVRNPLESAQSLYEARRAVARGSIASMAEAYAGRGEGEPRVPSLLPFARRPVGRLARCRRSVDE